MSAQRQHYWQLKSARTEARDGKQMETHEDEEAEYRINTCDDLGAHAVCNPLTVLDTYRVDRRVRLRGMNWARRNLDLLSPPWCLFDRLILLYWRASLVWPVYSLVDVPTGPSAVGSGINIQATAYSCSRCVAASTSPDSLPFRPSQSRAPGARRHWRMDPPLPCPPAPGSYAVQRDSSSDLPPTGICSQPQPIHPGRSRNTGANDASTPIAVLQYGSKYRKVLASLDAAADSCEREHERTKDVAEVW
ncbi:hypothetical protein K438DRAFT_1993853 [Mycena galopus ATCC 62051]|nr:hypothetical protein K438DRAFT_1993853 [Mycena galopus ATCC 62051]